MQTRRWLSVALEVVRRARRESGGWKRQRSHASLSPETYQSRRSGFEAAALIETGHQLLGRIDMEPFAVTPAGFDRFFYQPAPDALPLPFRMHGSIEEEEVHVAVPSHVREPDELIPAGCGHPREAASQDAIIARLGGAPRGGEEGIEGFQVKFLAPEEQRWKVRG